MPRTETRKKNKKLIIISIVVLVLLAIFGFVFYAILDHKTETPKVSETVKILDEYKNTDGKQIEIAKLVDDDEVANYFENVVKEKKNFVLYVSLPICNGDAAKFKEYVREFQRNNSVSFYYLTSDYIKETSVYETVKYYPSVIVYKDGKIVNYLKYDADEDKDYYKSYDGFEKWIKANVEF
jgi:hypothetical protein